jgi:hypothetical protein
MMQRHMQGLWKSSIVGALALILIGAGAMPLSWAADKEKKAAKTDTGVKVDRSGTARTQSTKASGAAIVAKSTACLGSMAPKITQVDPDEGKAGQKVTIKGSSLGAKDCLPTVSFGPGAAAKFEYVNETTLTTTVPALNKKGIRLLTVTTAFGGDSKAFLVK